MFLALRAERIFLFIGGLRPLKLPWNTEVFRIPYSLTPFGCKLVVDFQPPWTNFHVELFRALQIQTQ